MSLSLLLYDYPEQDCNGGGETHPFLLFKRAKVFWSEGEEESSRSEKKTDREREVEMLCVCMCVS